jgi:hypothetical protein
MTLVRAFPMSLAGSLSELNNKVTRTRGERHVSEYAVINALTGASGLPLLSGPRTLKTFKSVPHPVCDVEARAGATKDDKTRLDILWSACAMCWAAVEVSSNVAPGTAGAHGTVRGHVYRLAHGYLPGFSLKCAAKLVGIFVHVSVAPLEGDMKVAMEDATLASGGALVHRLFVHVDARSEQVLQCIWWPPQSRTPVQVYPSKPFPQIRFVCEVTTVGEL